MSQKQKELEKLLPKQVPTKNKNEDKDKKEGRVVSKEPVKNFSPRDKEKSQ